MPTERTTYAASVYIPEDLTAPAYSLHIQRVVNREDSRGRRIDTTREEIAGIEGLSIGALAAISDEISSTLAYLARAADPDRLA